MMKVLIINGSPKGKRSNSLRLTSAFVEGIKKQGDVEVKELTVADMQINSCKGCFCCWNKTPGKCIIADDMPKVIENELWADIIIWSFPLYYFNVPGKLKLLIDRQLPMSLPFMVDREDNVGSGSHPCRYDMSSKRHVLISTCGFYSAENNYDSVMYMFDHLCGYHQYETIFCGQGELFRVPELKTRTDEYLEVVQLAGFEFASGQISPSTKDKLEELLFAKEVFEKMADASWGIDQKTGQVEDESLIFTRQMAALYNKASFDGKERVLEICYTDLNKTYQILLSKDDSQVFADDSLKATTKITTPWETWLSISKGEIRGDEALAKGLYQVSGDLDLMIHWDKYFGGSSASNKELIKQPSPAKKPLMLTFLTAWITFWVALSIDNFVGGIITMAVCACLPLVMYNRKLTIYDKLSLVAVSLLSAFAMLTKLTDIALTLGYLGFGLLWILSCFSKEPLCAAYVKYNYGGDEALKNPIFMKTNYLIAMGWGILYVLIALWSYFLLLFDKVLILQIINNGATILMGIFTGWFENWYPRYLMSKNGK